MSACKILSNKSVQPRVTATMFSGELGSCRHSMWKYDSSWWLIFTQTALSSLHDEFYSSSRSLRAKKRLLNDTFIWNIRLRNVCELSPVYTIIKLSLWKLITWCLSWLRDTKSSTEDSRSEFLPWQTQEHYSLREAKGADGDRWWWQGHCHLFSFSQSFRALLHAECVKMLSCKLTLSPVSGFMNAGFTSIHSLFGSEQMKLKVLLQSLFSP